MDTTLGEMLKARPLEGLACDDADVVVRREGDVTVYECSFSFGPMRDEIRPMEGREFSMSVLVHDPDDTGLRDLGRAAEAVQVYANLKSLMLADRGEPPSAETEAIYEAVRREL